jgi:alkylated DNA repair dioxygenase AlkB
MNHWLSPNGHAGARPPALPEALARLAAEALAAAAAAAAAVEECAPLPHMHADICLANFYTTGGKLGMHQDRSESHSSLRRGAPVVSLSMGDACDFHYSSSSKEDMSSKVTAQRGPFGFKWFRTNSTHITNRELNSTPSNWPELVVHPGVFLVVHQWTVIVPTQVLLESGDLLVFGGPARMVFHGVSQIHANTAPQQLVEATGLRPGRLNLTFREFK